MAQRGATALSYMRNVGKSFGYAFAANFESMNPTVSAMFKETKEQTSNLYHNIKDFKANFKQYTTTGVIGDAKEIATDTWNNLLSDLKSGKWYNKERMDQYTTKMGSEMLGFDLDADFNFDFDDDFDSLDTDVEVSTTKATIDAMDAVGQKTSAAIAAASVHSANYIVQNANANTRAMFDLTSSGFNTVSTGLAALNSNMGLLVELGKPLTEHMQNSALFFSKSNEFQDKAIKLLEQLVNNTAPKQEKKNSYSSKKVSLMDLVSSDGLLNIDAIKKLAKDQYNNSSIGLLTSMAESFGGVKNMTKMISGSPLQLVLEMLTGKVFDIKGKKNDRKTSREAMENFNDVLAGFLPGAIGKLKNTNIEATKLPGFMKNILGSVKDMLPRSGMLKKPDTSRYNKGPVEWDGVARKALIDVIPKQLAMILATLRGTDDYELFDYDRGRWYRKSDAVKARNNRISSSANSAFGDLFSDIKRSVKKSTMSKKDQNAYLEQMQAFMNQMFMADDEDFIRFISGDSRFKAKKYANSMSEDNIDRLREIVQKRIKNNPAYLKNYARDMYTSRERFGKNTRDLLENGGMELSLHDKSKIMSKSGASITAQVDQYGKDSLFYLYGIWQNTGFIVKNFDFLVPGARRIGAQGKYRKQIKFDPMPKLAKGGSNNSSTSTVVVPRATVYQGGQDNQRKPPRDISTNMISSNAEEEEEHSFDLTKEEKDYLAKKQSNHRSYVYNDKMEETIARKQRNKELYEKRKRNKAERIENLKGGRFGKHIQNIQDLAGISTDAVVNILDSANQQINNFIYGTGKEGSFTEVLRDNIGGVFKQLTSTITDMVPQFIKDIFSDIRKRLNYDKDGRPTAYNKFKGKVKDQLKDWAWSLFKWEKYNPNRPSTDQDIIDQIRRNRENQIQPTISADSELFGNGSGLSGGMSGIIKFYRKLDEAANTKVNRSRYFGAGDSGTEDPTAYMTPAQKAQYDKMSDKDKQKLIKRINKNRKKQDKRLSKARKAQDDAAAAPEDIVDFFPKLFHNVSEKVTNLISDKLSAFIGKDDENKTKDAKQKIVDIMEDIGGKKSAVAAGALLGGGLSLLTGAALGPIAGAAIGAAVGFVSKSEKAQNILFGEWEDKDDHSKGRKGGVLNKEVSNFISSHVPNMGKGAALGAIGGTLLGSPVLGAILGSATGFVYSSEKAKNFLFGEMEDVNDPKKGRKGGLVPKKVQEFVKAKAPKALAGSIIGMLAGPFGPVGNAILGSAIGVATDTEKFKDWMFGERDKDGKRNKFGKSGFSRLIKKQLINPIVGIFQKTGDIIKQSVSNAFRSVGNSIKNFILKRLGAKVSNKIKNSRLARGIASGVKGAFNLVTKPGRAINNALGRYMIRNGMVVRDEESGMELTAEEQVERMKELGQAGTLNNNVFALATQGLAGQSAEDIKKLSDAMNTKFKTRVEARDNVIKGRDEIQNLLQQQQNAIDKDYQDNVRFNNSMNKATKDAKLKEAKKKGQILENINKRFKSGKGTREDIDKSIEDLRSIGIAESEIDKIKKSFERQLELQNIHTKADRDFKGSATALGELAIANMKGPDGEPLSKEEQDRIKNLMDNMSETELMKMINMTKGFGEAQAKKDELAAKKQEEKQQSPEEANKTVNTVLPDILEKLNKGEYEGSKTEKGILQTIVAIAQKMGVDISTKVGDTVGSLVTGGENKAAIQSQSDENEAEHKENARRKTEQIANNILAGTTNVIATDLKNAASNVVEGADNKLQVIGESQTGEQHLLDEIASEQNDFNLKRAIKNSGAFKFVNGTVRGNKAINKASSAYNTVRKGVKDIKGKVINKGVGFGRWLLGKASDALGGSIDEESGAGSGIARFLRRMYGGAGDSETPDINLDAVETGDNNPDIDSIGEDDTVRDQYNNEVENRGSKKVQEKLKTKNAILGGIASIPLLGTGITKIAEILTSLKNGLFGPPQNKKPGIFDKLFEKLTGATGVVGNIINFLTGGKLKGALAQFGDLSGALNAFVTPAITAGMVGAALSGKLDELWHKLGWAGRSNKEKGVDSNAAYTGAVAEDENGNKVAIAKDEKGNLMMDENGNYLSTNGKPLNPSTIEYTESKSTASLSERAWGTMKRAAGTAALSIATGNGTRLASGTGAATARLFKTQMKNAVKTASEKSPLLGKLIEKLKSLLGKVFEGIKKTKIGKTVGNAIDTFKDKVIKNIEDKAKNSGSAIIEKAFGDLAKTAAIAIKVVTIAWDFEEGYNNAGTVWKVLEPTFGQKVGAGVIHVLMNMIPVIGIFIPESLLIDLWASFILPKINPEEAEKLQAQRDEAQEALNKHNAENETDLSWEEYNKQVRGKYTWGEKISNGVKGVASRFTNGIKDTYTNAGGGLKGIAAVAGNGLLATSPLGAPVMALKSALSKDNMDKIKSITSKFFNTEKTLNSLAMSGDIKGLMSTKFDSDNQDNSKNSDNVMSSVGSKLFDTVFGISKILKLPTALVSAVGNKVREFIKTRIENVKTDASKMSESLDEMKTLSADGDASGVWGKMGSFFTRNETSGLSSVFNVIGGIGGIFYTIVAYVNKIIGPIKAAINGAKELLGLDENASTGTVLKEAGKKAATNLWNAGKQHLKNAFSGSGTGFAAGDSGMVSQRDPRYSNMSMGGRSVGEMGCGPASAVNAMNALGKHSSMSSAVNLASHYQTNGGTDLSYFKDEFGRNGIDSTYVSGRSMINSVASGTPTVLMGQDRSNTSKSNSPFGPNNHYVVANGVDRNGNVRISDPESRRERSYSPSILRNVKVGVAATGSKINSLSRRSNRRFGLGAGGADNKQVIWRYLTSNGLNDYAAAGLMGCWQAESGNRPDRIEGDHIGSFPGFDKVTSSSAELDNYTTNILFPAYTISINKKAYIGADGHYYPGFGLAQWTGPRAYQLLQFAKQKGGDWRDLKVQLDYALNGPSELKARSGLIDSMNNAGSIEKATELAFTKYEGCSMNRTDWYQVRVEYAKEIYNTYSGQTYSGGIFDGVESYQGSEFKSDDTQTTTSKTTGGIMSQISGIFSNLFGSIFGNNTDSSTSTTTGSSTNYSSSSSSVSGTAVEGDMANGIPYYNQGENPWASQPYTAIGDASQTIKTSGCGPTSMAMIMKAYGKNITPSNAAQYSLANGFRTPNSGTSWGYFKSFANTAGLNTDEFENRDKAKDYLSKNIPVIASMGPGDFTKGGHYIVMANAKDGYLQVNDPASRKRTGSKWPIDSAMSQAKRFWAITDKDGRGPVLGSVKDGSGNVGNVNLDDQYSSAEGSGLLGHDRRTGLITGGGDSGIGSTTSNQTMKSLQNMKNNTANRNTMSKDTAVLLKVIIELVSSVVDNTAKIDDILEVVKTISESSSDQRIKDAAGKISDGKSGYIPRSSTNQRTLDSLNDLRDKVDSILAS